MIQITALNLIVLDDRYVGRIDSHDAQPSRSGRPVRFYTASGPLTVSGYDVEHRIDAPLYVGGPSDWQINPAFESRVREIIKGGE